MSKKRLNSNALNIIHLLNTKQIAAAELTPHQRKVVVKYYLEEESHVSNVFIANFIGVTDVHVSRIKRQLLRNASYEIDQMDVRSMAVSLKKKKEEYQRKAATKEDFSLAWKIELDFVAAMQGLGFVYKSPDKHMLIGEQADFRHRLTEFFHEHGVPTADQFFGLLEAVRGNGGDGKVRGLLAKVNKPGGSGRRHRRTKEVRTQN